MRTASRLSQMLHVLLQTARHERPMTSETIARMLGTNPVVVRRTMAGLRDAGCVRSETGHGGGWAIAADLEQVSRLDVHHAVSLAALARAFDTRCDPSRQRVDARRIAATGLPQRL